MTSKKLSTEIPGQKLDIQTIMVYIQNSHTVTMYPQSHFPDTGERKTTIVLTGDARNKFALGQDTTVTWKKGV